MTVGVAAAAVVLTGVLTGVAAAGVPGRAEASTPQPASAPAPPADPGAASDPSTQPQGGNDLQPPDQGPSPPQDNQQPVAVSGGS